VGSYTKENSREQEKGEAEREQGDYAHWPGTAQTTEEEEDLETTHRGCGLKHLPTYSGGGGSEGKEEATL